MASNKALGAMLLERRRRRDDRARAGRAAYTQN